MNSTGLPLIVPPPAAPLPGGLPSTLKESEQLVTYASDNLQRHWKLYALVFLFYSTIFALIFRGVISIIPSILQERAFISADELAPFFDVRTQFIEQARGYFNDLTNGYEFRVRYSILTTWMRYYKILPFAIILSSIGTTFACFVATSIFLRKITDVLSSRIIIYSSALSALLINLLLIYATISHFYTLTFGFNQFYIAVLLLLYGLFLTKRHTMRFLLGAGIVTLLTPGVHYIILYLTVFFFLSQTPVLMRIKHSQNNAFSHRSQRFLPPES